MGGVSTSTVRSAHVTFLAPRLGRFCGVLESVEDRPVALSRSGPTLDAVGDVDKTLAQRHRGEKLASNRLCFS